MTVRLWAATGRWFLESSKSCLLLLAALPGLIDTLAQLLAWRSLLWLSIKWRQRYLTKSNILITTWLTWSLALHLLFCFSQEKPLPWKEIHTHIHTHTDTTFSLKSNLFLVVVVSDALILAIPYIAFIFTYITGAINALEYNEETGIQSRL